MIHSIRIDYSRPHAPGVFVVRCNADGAITGENRFLERRKMIHGADNKKAPPYHEAHIKKMGRHNHKTIKKAARRSAHRRSSNTQKNTTPV